MPAVLRCGSFVLPLARPLIMGIVNVTPDSFSDGGALTTATAAISRAHRLIDEGADIVDIGGESTRPGAAEVMLAEERRRVLPVLEALAGGRVPVSVDTQKPELMTEALQAGAAMINDVNALLAPGALDAVAATGAALCLMHKRGTPADMQRDPHYSDVVGEVLSFLAERVEKAKAAGVAAERLIIDPGFGFGKTQEHNLALLRRLGDFRALGVVVLVGLSRKSMIGRITGREVDARLPGSLAAAILAIQHGAHIVRVHDVAQTRDVISMLEAVGDETWQKKN